MIGRPGVAASAVGESLVSAVRGGLGSRTPGCNDGGMADLNESERTEEALRTNEALRRAAQTIAYPDPNARPRRHDQGTDPHVIVLFGATGDLARRKLLPGLAHLAVSKLTPDIRVVGTSLEDLDNEAFRTLAREAVDEFGDDRLTAEQWDEFASRLTYAPQPAGATALAEKVHEAEHELGENVRRLHYLSVPPKAASTVIGMLADAGLVENSRVIMEKPFGTDLASAIELNRRVHETFTESQIFRIDHFLGKEAAQNILAFRFANGLFEPIWNRNFIDHIQIDVPESLGLDQRAAFYEPTGAYKDMVVTHLFQILAFVAMEPPTALEPKSISEEKNKVFRSMEPIRPHEVVRGQFAGYRDLDGVARDSDTETFVALRTRIDNWRWAGVPIYLRTGKRMAEGMRIVSIAFSEAPKSMFPAGSGVGSMGPDHLTFDLADESKVSLSFYGKRPGPGFKLDKLSLQFSASETEAKKDALEAYERLMMDAMHGDHTLFTTAEGIESLWEKSAPLLADPPPVKQYPVDSWGPNAIHQMIAPNAWRLPFEREWRG